jgi:hypothetical protein
MAVAKLGVGAGAMTAGTAATYNGPNLASSDAYTLMVVGVSISVSSNSSSTTCAVTCGGTSMTQIGLQLQGSSTSRNATGLYYLFNPGSGIKSIVATPGGSSTKAGLVTNAIAFSGVDPSGVGAAQNGTAMNQSPTSVNNGYDVRMLTNGAALGTLSPTADYSNGQSVSGVGDYGGLQSIAGTGSTVSFTASGTATTPNSVSVALTPFLPTGTIVATEQHPLAALSGAELPSGTVAALVKAAVTAFTGNVVPFVGTISASAQKLLASFTGSQAANPPTFDSVGAGGTAASNSLSWNQTPVASGCRVYAFVDTDRSGTCSGITIGGTAMDYVTTIPHNNDGASGNLFVYKIDSVTSGLKTVVATLTGSPWSIGNSIAIAGAATADTPATTYGTGTSLSQTVNCTAGQLIVHAMGVGVAGANSNPTLSSLSGGTNKYNAHASYNTALEINIATASATFSATDNYSEPWSGIGIALNPPGPVTGTIAATEKRLAATLSGYEHAQGVIAARVKKLTTHIPGPPAWDSTGGIPWDASVGTYTGAGTKPTGLWPAGNLDISAGISGAYTSGTVKTLQHTTIAETTKVYIFVNAICSAGRANYTPTVNVDNSPATSLGWKGHNNTNSGWMEVFEFALHQSGQHQIDARYDFSSGTISSLSVQSVAFTDVTSATFSSASGSSNSPAITVTSGGTSDLAICAMGWETYDLGEPGGYGDVINGLMLIPPPLISDATPYQPHKRDGGNPGTFSPVQNGIGPWAQQPTGKMAVAMGGPVDGVTGTAGIPFTAQYLSGAAAWSAIGLNLVGTAKETARWVSTAQNKNGSSGNSISWTHPALDAGFKGALIVGAYCISGTYNPASSSATCNGTALTHIGGSNNSNDSSWCEAFIMLNPPTGSSLSMVFNRTGVIMEVCSVAYNHVGSYGSWRDSISDAHSGGFDSNVHAYVASNPGDIAVGIFSQTQTFANNQATVRHDLGFSADGRLLIMDSPLYELDPLRSDQANTVILDSAGYDYMSVWSGGGFNLVSGVAVGGTMGATAKRASASLSGTAGTTGATGTIAATAKKTAAVLTGAELPAGTVAVQLRKALFGATGVQGIGGTITATAKRAAAALTGVEQPKGTIAASAKKAAVAFTATQTQTGTVAATLKRAASALAGVEHPKGVLGATAKHPTASLTGVQGTGGAIAATGKKALTALTALQTQTGTTAAVLKRASAALTGSAGLAPTGTIVGTLKRAAASLAGIEHPRGQLSVTAKHAVSVLTATQTQIGTVATTLKKCVSSLAGIEAPQGVLGVAGKHPTASLVGIQGGGGMVIVTAKRAAAMLTGVEYPRGQIAAALQRTLAALTGTQRQTGTVTAAAKKLVANFAGLKTYVGTLTASGKKPVTALAGIQRQQGSISATAIKLRTVITAVETQRGTLTGTGKHATIVFAGYVLHPGEMLTGAITATLPRSRFAGQAYYKPNTPDSRVYDVAAVDRSYAVPAPDRIFDVPAQDRVYNVTER